MNKLISLALAAAILGLSACGGGSPDGGADTQAGVSSGGTGSFSNGPVTSFGSIVVNGIHFDQTKASVSDAEGRTLLPADIQLGMTVELAASPVQRVGAQDRAQASDIRILPALLGPVGSVDAGAGTLQIMGQTVRVSASQTYYSQDLPLGLASLLANDVVRVFGFQDVGGGVFLATRIERQAGLAPQQFVVRGVIQDLDTVNGRCRIGQQTIVYQWAKDTVGLANGRVATAHIKPYGGAVAGGAAALWQGEAMTLDAPIASDRDQATLDGVVTDLPVDAVGVLGVNGVVVDTRQMACADCASLKLGDRVQVQGRLVNQAVVASKVSRLGAP